MKKNRNIKESFYTYLITEKRLAPNSVAAYRHDVEGFLSFLDLKKITLERCSEEHIKLFLRHLKEGAAVASRTHARKISSLKSFFKFLAATFNYKDLGKFLVFPKLKQTIPRALSEHDIKRLLEVSAQDQSPKGVRNMVMLYLLYASGMRVSELLTITHDQVHFNNGFIQIIGKGGKERFIPLPTHVMSLLRYYIDYVYPLLIKKNKSGEELSGNSNSPHYLFVTNYRNSMIRLSRQMYWSYIKRLIKQAGIIKNISPHIFRHSLATHLLKNGVDLRSLQLLLGHQHLSTVQIYTHVADDDIKKEYDKQHPRS